MHGLGNDFALFDLREQAFGIDADIARALADRHTGIGFDQLLALRAASDPGCLAAVEIWNADGSRAEQCGNGMRCIGLYLERRGETPEGEFAVQGPVSRIEMESVGDGNFRVNMGRPVFDPERVPLTLEPSDGLYRIEAAGETLMIGAVSMGNPHALVEVPDIGAAPVARLGAEISGHPAFPRGCNVGFAQVSDRRTVELRVYERGSGETRACGSGACAAAAILIRNRKLDRKVHVNQIGGTLTVEWSEAEGPVMMSGPAAYLFEGMLS